MDLYFAAASPFVRKVMVVLHETGQLADVNVIDSVQTPLAPNPANKNPLGKIPSLTRPEGPALYDSRVICRYLADRAGADLIPPARQWEVQTLEATGDGIMDAGVLMVYEHRFRPAELQYGAYVDGQWAKIARALDALEERWISHLSGPLDLGQISVGCALGYLDFRHHDRGWRDGRDALARWFERFGARPSMQETRPV
ncbi:glutathione S-transferase family protein [Maribius pontilimi]|uniref:Glutathione S-transferase family protein n=1 Tax=Palleronia pontilimi TaxID=1964209 RepID=A0A934ICU9_9RHOB|nr:glutathione S-transferase family protein [Palleronia pontilimi]MBJ3763311.1 glutathione S-transferase family protein [Palleronia pontilimi]